MRIAIYKLIAALLSMIISAAMPFTVFAADHTSAYSETESFLLSSTPAFGSVGGEWTVFALARGGRIGPASSFSTAYYSLIEDKVASVCSQTGSGKLDKNKATENSRLVIALTSIGRNARNVAGYDLVEPLTDMAFVKRQGPTGAAFALHALGSNSIYGESDIRKEYVEYLLGRELAEGGWSLGTKADPDVTGMVTAALAPYPEASGAVARGVAKLSEMQTDRGGYESVGVYSSESCAQVIVALSAAGIDADTDSRFIKNGVSVLDALLSFYKGGGEFSHLEGGIANRMATEQAAYALCAYDRFKSGKRALFDMNDVSMTGSEPAVTATPAPTLTPRPSAAPTSAPSPTPTAAPSPTPTPAPSPTPTAAASPGPTDLPTEAPAPEASDPEIEVTDEPAVTDIPEPAEPSYTAPVPAVSPSSEPTEAAENTTEPEEILPEDDDRSGALKALAYAGAAVSAASVVIAAAAVFRRRSK